MGFLNPIKEQHGSLLPMFPTSPSPIASSLQTPATISTTAAAVWNYSHLLSNTLGPTVKYNSTSAGVGILSTATGRSFQVACKSPSCKGDAKWSPLQPLPIECERVVVFKFTRTHFTHILPAPPGDHAEDAPRTLPSSSQTNAPAVSSAFISVGWSELSKAFPEKSNDRTGATCALRENVACGEGCSGSGSSCPWKL